MKNALIIFIRNPVLGKVKTRLAATMGDQKALAIYQELLDHTQTITGAVKADKFVFYHDHIDLLDQWGYEHYQKYMQQGSDLGDKMKQAFEKVFRKGYDRVCIIGSDCYELTTSLLDQAFDQLAGYDLVAGPATDGGYYLLGMKSFYPELFSLEQYSTNKVMDQTLELAGQSGLSHFLLPVLPDIDTEEDWIKRKKSDAHHAR